MNGRGVVDAENQTTPPDLLARLRWLASEHWAGRHGLGDDMAVEIDRAAAEIERLRAFVQYVADYSNDPQVVKEAIRVGKPGATP